MPWYTVNLLLKSTHQSTPKTNPLWEERIVLIEAQTEEQARAKAETIGKDAEVEYEVLGQFDKAPQTLKWTFEQVERVCVVEDENLVDGTELFSRFLRESDVKNLLTPFDDE